MATLAENILQIRHARGFTQVRLAEVCGLTQPQISAYESGGDVPGLSALLKLATGLRVTLETLVEGVDVKFDIVIRELNRELTASVTTNPDAEHTELDTAPAARTSDISMEQVVPGYPGNHSVERYEPTEALAAPETVLDRIMAELLTLRGRVVSGPNAVDGVRRPGSSEGPVRRREGDRRKARKKTPPKRPSQTTRKAK